MATFKFKSIDRMGRGTLKQCLRNLPGESNCSAEVLSPLGRLSKVKGMPTLQLSPLSPVWIPDETSAELGGLFLCTYHLHLLLSKKPQPGPGTKLDVPKCLRTFLRNVAGLMGSWHDERRQEPVLLRFPALCCRFNGPD